MSERRSFRALPLALALLFLWLAPLSARAASEAGTEDEDAQAAFDRAVKLAQEHHYAEAVQALEQAAALDPTPPILFNLGRMREEVGDCGGAVKAYRQVLRHSKSSRLREPAERRLHDAERCAEKTPPAPATTPGPTPAPAPVPAPPPQIKIVTVERPAPPQKQVHPLHKQWWFWVATVGGALVLSGAAVGITLALTQKDPPGPPASDLGNMRFFLP